MSHSKVALFFFVDAMGWDLIKRHPHLFASISPVRKRLQTIFGYSSACDPSIISGLLPSEHTLWSSYFYSPDTSPFGRFAWMRHIPSFLVDNHRIRSRLSRYVAKSLGYTGYLQLYNMPFECLPLFDYAEKKRIYAPGGLPQGRNIFDIMVERNIPYHMCQPGISDDAKCAALVSDLRKREIALAYVTFGELDALMHKLGTEDAKVPQLLQRYQQRFERIISVAKEIYSDVSLYVFADHGMHDVLTHYDLQGDIQGLGLRFGYDYAAVYDSTMARFWFLNDKARHLIQHRLTDIAAGHILSDSELRSFGTFFPDRRYGETIFLMKSSTLIVPSFMGSKAIPGMHGYHPRDEESYAAILSNRCLPDYLHGIQDIFKLMLREIE